MTIFKVGDVIASESSASRFRTGVIVAEQPDGMLIIEVRKPGPKSQDKRGELLRCNQSGLKEHCKILSAFFEVGKSYRYHPDLAITHRIVFAHEFGGGKLAVAEREWADSTGRVRNSVVTLLACDFLKMEEV